MKIIGTPGAKRRRIGDTPKRCEVKRRSEEEGSQNLFSASQRERIGERAIGSTPKRFEMVNSLSFTHGMHSQTATPNFSHISQITEKKKAVPLRETTNTLNTPTSSVASRKRMFPAESAIEREREIENRSQTATKSFDHNGFAASRNRMMKNR